jgi:16S rRNA (uracil1498-N3)-methyltransferase
MEATKAAVESVKPGDRVAIWVGPEGGFAPEEVELARAQGNVQIISLGRRILRTETAGLAARAILMYRLES